MIKKLEMLVTPGVSNHFLLSHLNHLLVSFVPYNYALVDFMKLPDRPTLPVPQSDTLYWLHVFFPKCPGFAYKG